MYSNKVFSKEHVRKFNNGSNDVIRVTEDVVCKIGCLENIVDIHTLFLRDATITNFLTKRKVPIVSFAENFPKLPQIWTKDNFLLAFRTYIPNKQTASHVKGIGIALATFHKQLSEFVPDMYHSFNQTDLNTITFPTVRQTINELCCLDIKRIKQHFCNWCVLNFFKLKIAYKNAPNVLSSIREQWLHGDFKFANVLQTESEIILNDFECATYGPVEFDLASFIVYSHCNHFTLNQELFLNEYKENGGTYNQTVLNLFCKIHSLKRNIWMCSQMCAQKSNI